MLRFGLMIKTGLSDDPIAHAQQAEAAGFDVVVVGDHIGAELAPIPTLAAIAASTTSIRLGSMVFNADVRNPVQLAWQAAAIDRLSDGRFELGLGAGPHGCAGDQWRHSHPDSDRRQRCGAARVRR